MLSHAPNLLAVSVISERKLLVAISFASFLLVGVGIVLPAWVAFQIGGSRLVGFVLLAASVAGLLLAPVTGYIVDRCDRRQVALAGQAIRGFGLLMIAPAQLAPAPVGHALLIAGSALGALGFALHNGALSGLLQAVVPQSQRVAYVMRLSIARQLGLAAGTGMAGMAVAHLGSAISSLAFAGTAVASMLMIRPVRSRSEGSESLAEKGLVASSQEALAYLAANPKCLTAAITVGISFAIPKITNLLLPGFAVRALGGGSDLFGTLEMVAAIAGMAAVAVASLPRLVHQVEDRTLVLLTTAGLSLSAFSAFSPRSRSDRASQCA